MRRTLDQIPNEGILLLDKPKGKTSFSLIPPLRRLTGVQKIGHAGTLDPFATGLMVLLIGKKYTRLSDSFLQEDKEYAAEVFLGSSTDTYDCEGKITATSAHVPSLSEIEQTLTSFQGSYLQTPPMFSAKKIQGKKLYNLARQGIEIPRTAVPVQLKITLLTYTYPLLSLHITCSKGTYIRSLAHDFGLKLTTFAHLTNLRRIRSGSFHIDQAISGDILYETVNSIKRTL